MTDPNDMQDEFDPQDDLTTDSTSELIDVDGDGVPDAMVFEEDVDGDGVADVSGIVADLDGDGELDVLVQENSAQSIWGDLDGASHVADSSAYSSDVIGSVLTDLGFPGYTEVYEVNGTPESEMLYLDQQNDPMSCVVAASSSICNSMGIPISEEVLADILQENGVYDPIRGSDIGILDDVLNDLAIANDLDFRAQTVTGLDIDNLKTMLDGNVKILIGLDSFDLIADPMSRMLNDVGILPGSMGHAVQLIGIENTSEGNFAVINDPGVPDGAGKRIPMDVFMDAWEDKDHAAVLMSNTQTMASVLAETSADSGITLGGSREPLSADNWGRLYQGDRLFQRGVSSYGPNGHNIG